MDRYATRRDKLRKLFRSANAEAILITSFVNVTYLTGFTGDDSYLLVTRDEEILISDPRYTTQLEEECPGLELHIRPPGVAMLTGVTTVVNQSKILRLAVEGDSMTLVLKDKLAEALPKLEILTTTGLVEELRQKKDKYEINAIRQAVNFAERAFAVVRASLRPDQSEKQVADFLDHQLRLFGAKGSSFESIIAVGERAALPHARPTDKKISESEFVLIDWGASGQLYKSDLTRVLVTGKIPPKLERLYGVVLKAQLAGIEAIRPGVTAHSVDEAARSVIDNAGFGKYFGHGLGHGIGLQIHEGPRLTRGNQTELEPGMVVTVEPGIYLPDWGGVRIEDDVLVTKTGHEVLTSVPKAWEHVVAY